MASPNRVRGGANRGAGLCGRGARWVFEDLLEVPISVGAYHVCSAGAGRTELVAREAKQEVLDHLTAVYVLRHKNSVLGVKANCAEI